MAAQTVRIIYEKAGHTGWTDHIDPDRQVMAGPPGQHHLVRLIEDVMGAMQTNATELDDWDPSLQIALTHLKRPFAGEWAIGKKSGVKLSALAVGKVLDRWEIMVAALAHTNEMHGLLQSPEYREMNELANAKGGYPRENDRRILEILKLMKDILIVKHDSRNPGLFMQSLGGNQQTSPIIHFKIFGGELRIANFGLGPAKTVFNFGKEGEHAVPLDITPAIIPQNIASRYEIQFCDGERIRFETANPRPKKFPPV